MKRGTLILLLWGLVTAPLLAQMPLYVGEPAEAISSFQDQLQASPADLSDAVPLVLDGQGLVPGYVQTNPRGYSFLCRLELEIEEKLPVGMWMKIGDNPTLVEGLPRSNAYVRFKVLRF